MALQKEKRQLLQDSGFRQDFKRDLYLNRKLKKVFSSVAVKDHRLDWLRTGIESPNNTGTWQFFFNEPIQDEKRQELLELFGD